MQSSDKKATCPTRKQMKTLEFPGNRELNWTFLLIFSKRTFFSHFLHFLTTTFCFDFILQFWRSAIFLSRTLYLFLQLLSVANQQLFCVTESDIGQGPSNYALLLYKLLVLVLWFTLSFGEVSKTCRRMH